MYLYLDNDDLAVASSALLSLSPSPISTGLGTFLSGLRIDRGLEINQKVLGPIGATLIVGLLEENGTLVLDIRSAKANLGSISSGLFGVVRKKAGGVLLKYLNLAPNILSATKEKGNIVVRFKGAEVTSAYAGLYFSLGLKLT